MMAAGIKSPVPLDELESHLREDIQNQIRAGATPEQAFSIAAKLVGDASDLNREFEKVSEESPKRKRLRSASIVAGAAFVYAAVFATWILARRAGRIEVTTSEVLLALGSMAAMNTFGLAGRNFAKFLPVIVEQKRQAAATLAVMFVAAALWSLVWRSLSLDGLVHAQIVILWTMSPWLGLIHCFWEWGNRCNAARKKMNAVNA